MEAGSSSTSRTPRYDGEDLSFTTNRELNGWYAIGLAAEIFAVCGIGSFASVTLEQLAREVGVLRSDGLTPCVAAKDPDDSTPARRAVDILARIATARGADGSDATQCVIRPLGHEMSSASFALYTFSIAVFIQALVMISFSPIADYGSYRKRLLLSFAFTGATVTMAMIFVAPQAYVLGALLVIIGVICLGSTFVLLNSFLPLLSAQHPSSQHNQDAPLSSASFADDPTLQSPLPNLKLATQISSKGVGLGYAAAVSVQIFSIILLVLLKRAHFRSESTPLRFVLFMVGFFWLVLTVPGAMWLRKRPGPSLRVTAPWRNRLPAALQYLSFAWTSVWTTVRTALRLRQTSFFLIAWFLLSDAIATVSGTAILFARTELHMGTVAVALLSIVATTSGILGAWAWPHISRGAGWPAQHTLVACMALMEVIPLYGLLGFVPFIRAWGVGGLQQPWEIYPLGALHGFVMGGVSSYARAAYADVIPPGSEAAFYALYAITDKGSSAVGPAIVGLIVDRIGTIRPAFGFLAVLIALPMPIFATLDLDKGRAEAAALSKYLSHRVGEIDMEDYDRADESGVGEGLLSPMMNGNVHEHHQDE